MIHLVNIKYGGENMLIDFDGFIFMIAISILIFIIIFMKVKLKKTNMYLVFFLIFYIYICFLLKYTQFPIVIDSTIKSKIGQNVWRDSNFVPFNPKKIAIKTSILNILLTIPFGFGLPFIKKVNFKKMLILGILLGCLLESLQLIIALIVGFTFRYVDINDVIFNFCGVILGYGLFKIFMFTFKLYVYKLNITLNSFLKYIYEIKN